jgi:cytochrome P450
MTLLVAGHETTASALAWALERIARSPRVGDRLAQAVQSDDDAYVTATIQEVLRRRPVIPNAAPRLVKKPVTVGGWDYPPDVMLVASAYLVQHDPEIYPDPYEFRPERFLDAGPGTYTWIPFGGGRRRCLGASFAQLEMRLVLNAVFSQAAVRPVQEGMETPRRRAITISPRAGATIVLSPTGQVPDAQPAPTTAAA